MIAIDEDSLICDLAETYHILDYKGLSPQLVAALSVGLRADSRIKMKITNQEISADLTLQAAIVDRLSFIMWLLSGSKQNKKPESILDILSKRQKDSLVVAFDSAESFEEKRKAIIEKTKKGG